MTMRLGVLFVYLSVLIVIGSFFTVSSLNELLTLPSMNVLVNVPSQCSSSLCTSWILFSTRLFSFLYILRLSIFLVTDPEGTLLPLEGKQMYVLKGWRRLLTPFTVWSWMLQGLMFAISAGLSGLEVLSEWNVLGPFAIQEWFLVVQNVLFEISLPVAALIFLVVRFLLIPAAQKMNPAFRESDSSFAMHNFNLLFVLVELALNNLAFHKWHVIFVVLYCLVYTTFAWLYWWSSGILYYFFLDYRKPGAELAYMGLLAVLSVFFAMSWGVSMWFKSHLY